MQFAHLFARRKTIRPLTQRRTLVFEPLQARELLDGDTSFGPQPAGGRGPVVEFGPEDTSLVDDVKRAVAGAPGLISKLGKNAAGNAPTVVVNGGQAAARTGDAATEVVNGGQAAQLANAPTEVVDGGQAAARTGDAATEVVNGGQEAARAAGEFDHLPKFIHTPEYCAAHEAHLAAVRAGDTAEAIRTSQEMRALEVLEYPDGSRVHYPSGQPYVPANQIDDAAELAGDTASAGKRVAGKVLGAVGTAADFVVDPVLGTIFYDENLETGEQVFGENSYCGEAYANLQCVPALGGPLADVAACLYTACTTDWIALFFSDDSSHTPEEVQAAIDRYRDLEDRKDYDANHGNQYQAALWEEVLKAKDELRSMGIDPDKVR